MKNLKELDICGNYFSELPSFLKYLDLEILKMEWPLYMENLDCPPVDGDDYSNKQYKMDIDAFKRTIDAVESTGKSMINIKDYHNEILGVFPDYNIKVHLNFCIAAIRK